jgi:hypothetical protein
MQESSASFGRSWVRISIACFMFAVSALAIWDDFFRFAWLTFLRMGLLCLIFVPRQQSEAPRTYLSKPRNVASFALMFIVVASAAHHLYWLLTR